MIKGEGKYFCIPQYAEGYNLTLLNTVYHKPKRVHNKKTNKDVIIPDVLDLIVIDNVSHTKFVYSIPHPTYDYFFVKPEYRTDFNNYTLPIEQCERISVRYTDLLKDIAERTNNTNFYYENIKLRNFRNNDKLHTHPNVMMSDSNIEEHYRWKFTNTYVNEPVPLNKAFFDIEVAAELAKGDFPEPGECPVTALAYIDERTKTIYSLLYEHDKYTQIPEFKSYIAKIGAKEIRELLIKHVGGEEKYYKKYNLDQFEFVFKFFKTEIELMSYFFDLVNANEPDFMLGWNIRFDVPYLIARIEILGYDPAKIICNSEFVIKELKYFIDNFSENIEDRTDFFFVSSKTVWIDHMIDFFGLRKGFSAIPSNKLNDVGTYICNIPKLDYSHITSDIKKLPLLDYKTFVYYNIIDTIVEYCVEKTTDDMTSVFADVTINNTRYDRIFKKSIFLKNRACKEHYIDGLVFTNNINRNNTKVPFSGGYKSNPLNNSEYSMIKTNGIALPIYDKLNDFDYKSMYPMMIILFNIGMETLICHINIPTNVLLSNYRNRFGREAKAYLLEGQFTEDLQSHNFIEFFHRWFRFADYAELIEDVKEYFTKEKVPNGNLMLHDIRGRLNPFQKLPNKDKLKKNLFIKIIDKNELNLKDKKISFKELDYKKFGAVSDNPTIVDFDTFYEVYSNQYRLEYISNGMKGEKTDVR